MVALDPPPGRNPETWVSECVFLLKDLTPAFKVGLPLLLRTGVDKLRDLFSAVNNMLIADLKLADIGDVMTYVIEVLAESGVNSVIAHAFIGREGALDKLVQKSKEVGIKPILVVSMSHPGSIRFIDKHLGELVEEALDLGVWGVVAPATRTEVVRLVRDLARDKLLIFSPGVGAQGAEPGSAICAGADYEIVGRAVTNSPRPREALETVVSEQVRRVERCRS